MIVNFILKDSLIKLLKFKKKNLIPWLTLCWEIYELIVIPGGLAACSVLKGFSVWVTLEQKGKTIPASSQLYSRPRQHAYWTSIKWGGFARLWMNRTLWWEKSSHSWHFLSSLNTCPRFSLPCNLFPTAEVRRLLIREFEKNNWLACFLLGESLPHRKHLLWLVLPHVDLFNFLFFFIWAFWCCICGKRSTNALACSTKELEQVDRKWRSEI